MINFFQLHPEPGSSTTVTSSRIGVTINQDDFARFYPGFYFQINYKGPNGETIQTQTIQMGRTGMYQTSQPITAQLVFPTTVATLDPEASLFPQSLMLDIMQMS